MNNIKDYREKELKLYIVATIIILLSINKDLIILESTRSYIEDIFKVINTVLTSASMYIFAYISDSFYSSHFKEKVMTLFGIVRLPGQKIFTEIKNKNKDLRFSAETALEVYKEIYNNMPSEKKKKYIYENENWYKLYSKYRDIPMIYNSNKDYLLCRDMFFATLSLIVLYFLCFIFDVFEFDLKCLQLFILLLIINFINAINKSKRLVYNVIAYDISKNTAD